MQQFFTDYLSNLEELHMDTLRTIGDLPQDALDWTPFSGANSFNVIVTHIAGAEKYWLGDIVAGVSSERDREAEFRVRDLTIGELEARLQKSLLYVGDVLGNLSLEVLDSCRISPRNGIEVTVNWALTHALKHTAVHLGHIQITRQLWEGKLRP